MSQEIESVKPAISVVIDDGDFIINSVGPIGKAMAQAVLPLLAFARRVTVIADGEMKVMKRGAAAGNGAAPAPSAVPAPARTEPTKRVFAGEQADSSAPPAEPADIQDQFAADLAAGRTGEAAMGEQPSPTPGPNDPVPVPAAKPAPAAPARRKPQIFQDAAAPPAPELAEAEMARLLAEAAQAEADAARVAEDQRFQRQQAVQAQAEPAAEPIEEALKPRRRERNLAVGGRTCGRCAGAGKVMGESGFEGACPVCHGEGTVKSWDRVLKVR
jgi:hypothetical protein